MFEQILKLLKFSAQFDGEAIDLGGIKHRAIPFSKSNFHEIPSAGKIASISFIDGGNAELLRAPNFSLQQCRVAYCTFSGNKRLKQERKDFFVLVTAENGKFIAKTFSDDPALGELALDFDMDDENFRTGKSQGTPSSVVSALRRFAELKIAGTIESDVIVLDGSLQQKYTFEDKFMNTLINSGRKVIGLCKTSGVLTKSGNSAIALMNMNSGQFAYYPVAEINDSSYNAEICFARLHKSSKHVFKIDFSERIDDSVLALLAENSKDPVFLGYPYGLVLADRLARVSDDEADYMRTKILSKAENKDLIRYLNALNAHDVLDNI